MHINSILVENGKSLQNRTAYLPFSGSHDVKERNVPEQTLEENETRHSLLTDFINKLFPIHKMA